MPRHVISVYRDALNREGHELLSALQDHFPEWKIRAAVSRYLGMRWNKCDIDSGFHFSKHEPIARVEKAVLFLCKANEQKTLSPRFNEKRPEDVFLPQARMKQALEELPKCIS